MMNIVKKSKNNVFSKLLATFMSGLLTVGQASAAVQGSMYAVHKTSASSRKITKKQALAISGGVASAVAVVGGAIYLLSCFDNEDIEDMCDKAGLHNPKREVPAEEWFTRLGGTQADVNEYVSQDHDIKDKISNNTDERVKEQFDQIDKDFSRTSFNDTSDGARHELLRKILKVSILKNDLNQGSKGYSQGFDDFCAMVICKFLGEGSEYDLETEAKIYYVYNVLANNEFLTVESLMANASDIMNESLRSKCFNKYSFYRTFVRDDKEHSYACNMMIKFWTPFGTRMFFDGNDERIIKVWDRIITDDSVYENCRFDHRKAFVKLFTVINLYVVKYWNKVKRLDGYLMGDMTTFGATVGTHLHEIINNKSCY